MLELRPNCECCDADLAPDSVRAMICSFECTFCTDCAQHRFNGQCPTCSGPFVPRPIRRPDWLARFPASQERRRKPHAACAPQA